ncbi:MAG: crossover junction endodeoxyribonuclease RuvC [Candidatus Uhrbacteria bacterium]
MHTILGIDPGFGRMGFAVIHSDGRQNEAVDFGVMTTPANSPIGERLLQLEADLCALLEAAKPDLVAMEKLFTTVNQKTAMQVAEARGMVLLTMARHGLPMVEFTPNQVKSAVTGDGAADKKSMQKMVARLFDLPRPPKPDDAADALAIALTASTGLIRRLGKS